MKRIIAIVLMLAFFLISLTSCDVLAAALLIWSGTQQGSDIDAQNEFFAPEYLAECKLSDMPIPNVDGSFRTESKLYLNMTEEEFDAYSKAVFDYLGQRKMRISRAMRLIAAWQVEFSLLLRTDMRLF